MKAKEAAGGLPGCLPGSYTACIIIMGDFNDGELSLLQNAHPAQ